VLRKEAVRILRAAYMESTASDTLYNARQYLQDRAWNAPNASGLRPTRAGTSIASMEYLHERDAEVLGCHCGRRSPL